VMKRLLLQQKGLALRCSSQAYVISLTPKPLLG
jgi:hypothetical protein